MKITSVTLLVLAAAAVGSCRGAEPPEIPVATPSLTVNRDKAPLGSPIDITYRFVVAPNAPPFSENYRVFVHFLDADDQLMFTDDHNPPGPTTTWKGGQIIEYTRTMFIPIYPYVGVTAMHMGLHSVTTQKRLPLSGENVGSHAYRVGRIQIQPQTENVFTVFKNGWHNIEVADHNASVEWQWTKKQATLAFKNPKKDSLFYFDVDNPGDVFNEPQHVRVSVGREIVDEFQLTPKHEVLRKIPIKAGLLGSGEMAELQISVDKTFVPAVLTAGASNDPRELGVRVFHAFVEPAR